MKKASKTNGPTMKQYVEVWKLNYGGA